MMFQENPRRFMNEKMQKNMPLHSLSIILRFNYPLLFQGDKTFNLLSKLTLNVSGVEDFSKLPIPFYCIATDM